jgi:hypothetical protein
MWTGWGAHVDLDAYMNGEPKDAPRVTYEQNDIVDVAGEKETGRARVRVRGVDFETHFGVGMLTVEFLDAPGFWWLALMKDVTLVSRALVKG